MTAAIPATATFGALGPVCRLGENLTLMQDWHGLTEAEYRRLAEHGQRVRKNAGPFP
jgi:hypothetical protein